MRGRQEKYSKESAQEVKEWIQTILKEDLGDSDPVESSKDGVLLCRLVNEIVPNSASFKVSKMPFVQMENIAAFLRAVEAIGVPHHELFETVDLYELKDPVQVLITIRSLSRHAHQKNPNIPVIGPKLAQPNQKRAPFKKEPNVASWNVHQYGYMHGASQGSEGVVFGGTHNVIAPLEMQKSKMTKGVDQSDEDTKFESPPISNTATPQLGGGRIGFALGKAARGLNTESDISKLSISQNNFRLDQSGTHKTSEKDLLKEVIKTDYVGENDPQEKSTTQSLDSIQQNPKIEEKAIAVQDHTMPKVLETADVTFEQKEQQPTVEDEFDFNSQNIDSSTTGRSRYADLQLPIKSPPFESRHTLRKPTAEKNSISSSSKVNITQSPSQPVRTISLDLDSPKSYTQQPSGFELPKKSPVLATLSKSPTESPKPPPKPIGLSIRPANHPKGPREFIDSSKRKTTRSVFGNDFDSDNDDGYNGKNSSFQIQRNQVNAQLAVGHSNSQSSVMIEDPSIYHYDEVYDSMKAAENQLQAASSDDKTPKYIDKLLDSKRIRERDKNRARDILLKRDRDSEGDLFADKEMFVTSAYKKQQEEIEKQDQEDREKDGPKEFYRNILERNELSHEAVVTATKQRNNGTDLKFGKYDDDKDGDLKATKKAQQVNESAGFEKIQINDDGQVVDERQLLKAGLNVVKNESNREKYVKSYQLQHRVPFESRTRTQIQARRQLQTEKIMQQIEDDEQNRAIEDQKQRDNITQQYKSRKTESSISSARERYLARKQAARLGEDLNRKSTS